MNREKVIKGLENLRDSIATDYIHDTYKAIGTINDALELLKKQAPKPVWYETNRMTGLPICYCPSCNEVIKQYAYGDIRKTYYCQYCGQAVKWE